MTEKAIERICKGCTPFGREVLKIVSQIPFGQTRSYKWVAKKLGRPMAARAVGQALKRNPLPLVIPCHRVVRSDHKIGGYRWGRALKIRLLEYEKSKAKVPGPLKRRSDGQKAKGGFFFE